MEEYWAQLEEAASCAKVIKVDMSVHSAGACRALAVGFSKNPLLSEVTLLDVPKDLVESVRETLCTNTVLTVTVSDKCIEFPPVLFVTAQHHTAL